MRSGTVGSYPKLRSVVALTLPGERSVITATISRLFGRNTSVAFGSLGMFKLSKHRRQIGEARDLLGRKTAGLEIAQSVSRWPLKCPTSITSSRNQLGQRPSGDCPSP